MVAVTYRPGSGGEPLRLDTLKLAADPKGLRGRAWSYELRGNSARNFGMSAREAAVSFQGSYEMADLLRRAADADVRNGTPGRMTVGEWSQSAYIVGSSPVAYQHGRLIAEFTAVLLDGCWWRDVRKHYPMGLSGGGMDYAHDYGHDLAHGSGKGTVLVSSALGADPCITLHGPAASPYVTVSNGSWSNRYQVDVSLASGQSCTVDSRGTRPSVTVSDDYGNARPEFAKAVRDGGERGGSYAFARLPSGALQVEWSGAFAFDLEWREYETEPPWLG